MNWLKRMREQKHAKMRCIEEEMSGLAAVWRSSNCIEEFKVKADLKDFKHVSTSMFSGPFAVLDAIDNRSKAWKFIARFMPLIVCGGLGLELMMFAWHGEWLGFLLIMMQSAICFIDGIVFIRYMAAKEAIVKLECHDLIREIDAFLSNYIIVMPSSQLSQTTSVAASYSANTP